MLTKCHEDDNKMLFIVTTLPTKEKLVDIQYLSLGFTLFNKSSERKFNPWSNQKKSLSI
jgi:hypothetical protein